MTRREKIAVDMLNDMLQQSGRYTHVYRQNIQNIIHVLEGNIDRVDHYVHEELTTLHLLPR